MDVIKFFWKLYCDSWEFLCESLQTILIGAATALVGGFVLFVKWLPYAIAAAVFGLIFRAILF